MTLKGGEIFLRTATGGFTPADIQACAMYNGVYATICNNSISPGNRGIWEDAGGGGSAVYDPRGEIIAKAQSGAEQEVDATDLAVRSSGLARSFGDVDALDGFDLEVRSGEILGLVGPNGAGKTTFIRVVAGLLAPDDGEIEVLGRRPGRATGPPGA